MRTSLYLCGALLYHCASTASAALSLTGPSTGWIAVQYANPNLADPSNDQQTGGIEGDIVGNASLPSFYTAFDNAGTPSLTDGSIGFRVRLAGDASPAGLKTVIWIGIDANADGKIDLFAGAIEDSKIGLYRAGTGQNISPSTTSISTTNPYYEQTTNVSASLSFTPVSTIDSSASNFNIDGGSGGGANNADHFVTFVIPFSSLVSAINSIGLAGVTNFNENSGLRYVVATSNQANSLNMDLNGISGGVNSSSTWTSLGGLTTSYSSSGLPDSIPEPSGLALSAAALSLTFFRRKR